MQSNLSNIDWVQFLDCKSVNETSSKGLHLMHKFIPKVQNSGANQSPQWMNKSISKIL